MTRSLLYRLLALFALALAVRLALYVAWHGDYTNFESGDYILYSLGAEHIAASGNFDNSLFLVRPPLFPLVIFGLGINNDAVLLFNAAIGALIAPVTPLLGRAIGLNLRTALLAGLIVALDPTSIVYSTFLGPEPLANLLLAIGVLLLIRAVMVERRALGWAAAAALALALSTYARPATYLVWIGLSAWLLVMFRSRWRVIVSFAALSALAVSLWIAHNTVVFQHRTFSTVGPFAMLYYRAASIERLGLGVGSDEMDTIYLDINRRIEARLGRPVEDVTVGTRESYLAASPEIAAALQAEAVSIMLRYPVHTLVTVPVGFSRMFGLLPRASNMLPFTDSALSIGLQMVWNGVLLVGTAAGLVLAWRARRWLLFWCVLLVSAYYTAGTLLVKSAGMTTRERSMLGPFMALACAYAVMMIWQRVSQRNRQLTR
jgi:hypothetical protein